MNDRLNTNEPCPPTVHYFKCHGRLLFAMDDPFTNVTPPPPQLLTSILFCAKLRNVPDYDG